MDNDSRGMIGSVARDSITGFSGVVTGVCSYITGCDQALLQPEAKSDGEFVESRWFDVTRLLCVKKRHESARIINTAIANGPSGPDKPAPKK